jgi:hypothetical protein
MRDEVKPWVHGAFAAVFWGFSVYLGFAYIEKTPWFGAWLLMCSQGFMFFAGCYFWDHVSHLSQPDQKSVANQ